MRNEQTFTTIDGRPLEKRDAFVPLPGEYEDRLYSEFEIAGEYECGAETDTQRLWCVVFPDDDENAFVAYGESVFFNWPYPPVTGP